MKTIKYITLFFLVSLLSACSDNLDLTGPNTDIDENATAVISISSSNLVPVNMNKTRAAAAGDNINQLLSKVNDLNIRITKTDNTTVSFYCTASNISSTGEYIKGSGLDQITAAGGTKIHCENIKASEVKQVEVIANYKKEIPAETDWSTLKEANPNPDNLRPPFVDDAKNFLCMMYGKTEKTENNSIHNDTNNVPCKLFKVQLKRSRAIITLRVDATNLKKGVEITPTKVRLCNVPQSCTLSSLVPGKGNKITAVTESPTETGSLSISQESISSQGTLKSGGTMGVHAEKDGTLPLKFFPFIMYENMQGTHNESNTAHHTKYPNGISNVTDAKDPAKNYKYSYMEVEAEYKYREIPEGKETGPVKIGGKIVYRFFLGNNATNNFDIEGNHYYKLTMSLKGYGGANEDGKVGASGNLVVNDSDLSWRVDMETSDWGFEKSQYDFDCHYINGEIDVVGTNWKFNKVLGGDGSSSWLVLNIVDKHDGMGAWVNPTSIITNGYNLNIVNGKLKFNIQPMVYMQNGQLDPAGQFNEYTYTKSVNYRQMIIEVENTDTKKKDTVTVRQYAPIPVTVNGETFFMERFEEYGLDDMGNTVVGYPWKRSGTDILSTEFYNLNGLPHKYVPGDNVSATQASENSMILANFIGSNGTEYGKEGKGGAMDVCYQKGNSGIIQGAAVSLYFLPTKQQMEAMFAKSKDYDSSWGPFEPMHIYEDYWTSTIIEKKGTFTKYYNGVSYGGSGLESYLLESDRDNKRYRVRAAYFNNPNWSSQGD